ncbi:DNA-binding response regulator [Dictyobacter alpinus]|uniref:DNA-binding response regulator n=1 Tax=Dictyobacter alpinus TaxID=2014873 RepID=A0A402BFF9_9CHLR|nr:response regulator [Dictyobacter alpinus]GCE30012.1 DNA-binding response regulator [Dictyobacter alpinus]
MTQDDHTVVQVLVADDKAAIRTGLAHMVTRISPQLQVLEAANGLEAWKLISTSASLQLAFIDIRMPGLDGLQLCEQIRKSPYTIRIAIISAFREFDYARQALRFGVVDYLLKPINPADITRLVQEVIVNTSPGVTSTNGSEDKRTSFVIDKVREWIYKHLEQDITLAEIAESLHYTPNYLSALFKREVGKGFQEYLADCRMQRAASLLQESSLRMTDIAAHVGYTNPRAFSTTFKRTHNITPTEYREKYGRNSVD